MLRLVSARQTWHRHLFTTAAVQMPKEEQAFNKSQQGLYSHNTKKSVRGSIFLKLKHQYKTEQNVHEALVQFSHKVFTKNSCHWILGFSYDFALTAAKYLSAVTRDELKQTMTNGHGSDIYWNSEYLKNNNYQVIMLPHADDVDSYLENREEFRHLLAQAQLQDKVNIFEVFGLNRPDMKVLGGRFLDGVGNPHSAVSLERHVLVTLPNTMQGSTFMFAQVFAFDQRALENLSNDEMETMIGVSVRHQHTSPGPTYVDSHVGRMRNAAKSPGLNVGMLRIPLIVLNSVAEPTDHAQELISEADAREMLKRENNTDSDHIVEQGLFFAGCCQSPENINKLIAVMSGDDMERRNIHHVPFKSPDRLLSFIKGKFGGYFWIPPARVLQTSGEACPNNTIELPDIWNVDRHQNSYMFFNSHQWLHAMSSGKCVDKFETENVPSARIQHLASAMFDQWDVRSFKKSKLMDLPHLEEILIQDPFKLPKDFVDLNGQLPSLEIAKLRKYQFDDRRFATLPMGVCIKDVPVVMRKGLAIREQIRFLTDPDATDTQKEIQSQLDSLRLQPGEIIVGTLEEYSLASGKIAMEYLCYGEERENAKAATLSELSAMGHIVPDYGIILKKGLSQMIKELEQKIHTEEAETVNPYTNTKIHFWKGAKYALQGIDIYLQNYKKLAIRVREQWTSGKYVGINTMRISQRNTVLEPFPGNPLKCILPLTSKIENFEVGVNYRALGSHKRWSDPIRDGLVASGESREVLNLRGIEMTLQSLRERPPVTLLEAVQLFFVTHACLHWTADPVSAGRLDQIFQRFYDADLKCVSSLNNLDAAFDADTTVTEYAQDIIDALCLKWDEKVNMSMTTVPDAKRFGTTAVMFGTGPFPSGDSINQWFHQVNVGGMIADGHKTGTDGCNNVTLMFLKAMRRLPVSAPCVSLRVNEQTKPEILDEAAKAILSGGAHPPIMHDRNISEGLSQSLTEAYKGTTSPHYSPEKLLMMSRSFSSDGCYEPLMVGYSDFSFLYVSLLQALECALNRGAIYYNAGHEYFRGEIQNWSSPPPEEIKSFDHLLKLTIDFHLAQQLKEFFSIPLSKFGALANVCPSPLLSCLMHNAIERGKDLTEGGAMVHIVTPMLVGLTNFIDSLFAIKVMVYDPNLRVTTLSELTDALKSNWGETDTSCESTKRRHSADRYQHLRNLALSLPKFAGPDYIHAEKTHWITPGSSTMKQLRQDLNTFGKEITNRVICKSKDIASATFTEENMQEFHSKYSEPDFPFRFTVCIGAGTFENYAGIALTIGASADGRLSGQPIASDCSPAPSPIDLPPLNISNPSHYPNIADALKVYDDEAFRTGFANACEVDIKITENTNKDALKELLRRYAHDEIKATSILTFTVGDQQRYVNGIEQPNVNELFRVRMGGWTNFYTSMSPVHQKQHQRRPFYKIDMSEFTVGEHREIKSIE